ncbi:MAG: SpoIIE family protein phosphatase [Candidatus Latescibacteria bacterium]|nr:SpoIIE family protein phosphatase [Candidatus Latescibacterota bacterium]
MPYLHIITAQGEAQTYSLSKETVMIGRAKDADILLHDAGVSRHHAQLRRTGELYLVKDMDSSNGTFLNETVLQQEIPLRVGDQVRVGQTIMKYLVNPPAKTTTANMVLGPNDPQFQASMFKADQLPYTMVEQSPQDDTPTRQHNLLLLNRLSKDIISMKDEYALAEFLAQHILDWFQADCCAIVYQQSHPDGYQLDIKAIACSTPDMVRDLTISKTAAQEVIENKMALFTTNAGQDERFKAQDSVINRGITSILCAPLWHEDQVFGLFYLDTTEQEVRLNMDHLGMLSAVANLAAIKIDNLRLMAAAVVQAAMERELALAAQIQARLLPGSSYAFAGFRCLGFNRACLQVGGDYFDFIPLNEDVLTVTIADVAGKGPAGALLMAACESILTTLVETGLPLQERIARLNQYILKHANPRQFITFFHAEIDRRTRTLIYCNAGHNPPILLPAGEATTVLMPTGIPIGIMEERDVPHGIHETPFEPGAKLVLYTDGVTETRNAEDEEYGEQRLLDLVAVQRGSPAPALRDAILQDVDRFAAGTEHQDDLTLAIVEHEV